MESSYSYKGYWIDYSSLTGTTIVRDIDELAVFKGKGERDGSLLAKNFIDKLTSPVW